MTSFVMFFLLVLEKDLLRVLMLGEGRVQQTKNREKFENVPCQLQNELNHINSSQNKACCYLKCSNYEDHPPNPEIVQTYRRD